MTPTPTVSPSKITWSRIRHSRNYQLNLGTEVWATLKRPGFWSCDFLAETHDSRWIFRRAGFFRTYAEVLNSETSRHVASFQSDWGGGGVLSFDDGHTFRLACSGWWRPVWTLTSEQGEPVLSLHRRDKSFQLPGVVSVPNSHLALLMLFALYRVLQSEEDAAAVAVIAAS